MNKSSALMMGLLVAIVVAILFCLHPARHQHDLVHDEIASASTSNEPIEPLPFPSPRNEDKVQLGEMLFLDPILSQDNSISCSSCHSLNKGGADVLPRSIGIGGSKGEINAPTVFNSALNFKQFWDGRAETLEDQVDGPIQNPNEMGSTWKDVMRKLRKSPYYLESFSRFYSDGIQPQNVRDVIAEFEKSLVTPNSRFDRYLQGNHNALTTEEQHGYALFKEYGCSSCHQGTNIGGNLFEKFGVMRDYFADRGEITKADFGRFNVTGDETDKYVFKVPSLRNVAITAPYFHDGTADSLEEAVRVMSVYQLGRSLPDEDIEDIVKFLKTLTGEYKGKGL
jgi:cytochrome c peroxidase